MAVTASSSSMTSFELSEVLNNPLSVALSFRSLDLSTDYFRRLFTQAEALSQIPAINEISTEHLASLNGKLVCFDGMVQDTTQNGLVYPLEWKSSSENVETSMLYFSDDLPVDIFEPQTIIVKYGHIYPMHLISIPGTTTTSHPSMSTSNPLSSTANTRWRAGNKCESIRDPERGRGSAHQQVAANFYSQDAAYSLRLCDNISVFGILAFDQKSNDAPTIFVIWHTAKSLLLPATHIPRSEFPWQLARASLLARIGIYLGGDRLAAAYLLLHLLSDRAVRRNSTLVVSRAIKPPAQELVELVRLVFAPAVVLPMALDVINKDHFYPRSTSVAVNKVSSSLNEGTGNCDIDNSVDDKIVGGTELPSACVASDFLKQDFLCAGMLQLAQGSVCVIDEGLLEEGAINEQGVRNISTLSSVFFDQVLQCEFPFSTVSVPLNLRSFVVTKGKRSLFADDDFTVVPLAPVNTENNNEIDSMIGITEEIVSQQALPITDQFVELWRGYVEWVSSPEIVYAIDESMVEVVEKTFISEKNFFNQKDLGHDDEKNKIIYRAEHLDQLLTLSRNLSRSCGEANLKTGNWENARNLERIRILRLFEW